MRRGVVKGVALLVNQFESRNADQEPFEKDGSFSFPATRLFYELIVTGKETMAIYNFPGMKKSPELADTAYSQFDKDFSF